MKPPLTGPEAAPEFVTKSVGSGGAQPSAKAIYEQRKNYAKTAATMGEISEYKVEHLATFSVERKGAILTVEDSIRKLKLLDARGKVWTQEVFLYVDEKCVKLLDMESHDELEHFPLVTIQHIQPVIGACQFDNICALVMKDPEQKTPDINLFQCTNAPADQVCVDINSAWQDIKSKKGKKSRPETLRKQRESVRAMMNGENPPNSQINVKEKVAAWTSQIEQQTEPMPTSPRSLNGLQEDSPEMHAFKVQRDVQMLNHALDDIELFVQRMQKSAEAAKELNSRKSKGTKRSSKRKNREPGLGMLELRARLPPSEMFQDCYQKFKFCFNLLAKLKTHIQNPNAVELVHFLFQPLTMIVSTSGKDLPESVQCPLLNKETIEFLHNCLTSVERQLLKDLGDFWNKCKSDFPKDLYFAPYVPHFASGWEPPPLPFLETEASELAAAIATQADQVQKAQQAWVAGGSRIEDALQAPPLAPPNGEANLSRKASMGSPNGKEAASAFKQHVQNHVARNQALNQQQQPSTSNGLPSNRKLARAMETYRARNEKELSINLDDLVTVLDDNREWWLVQDAEGESGYVPGTILLLLSSSSKTPPTSIPPPPQSPSSSSSGSNFMAPTSNPVPPPPPPPPPPPAALPPQPAPVPKIAPVALSSVQLKKTTPQDRSMPRSADSSNNLQEELKQRVSSQKQKPRNFVIPKKHASSAALRVTMQSESHDVKHWLHSLGFSFLTCESLGILTGEQLFSLTKEDLKQVCEEEASRVYSQIEVQRSMMSETTNAESEFQKIMRMRRENADI